MSKIYIIIIVFKILKKLPLQDGAEPVHIPARLDPLASHTLIACSPSNQYPGLQLYIATVPSSNGAISSVANSICPLAGSRRSGHSISGCI